jgi:glycolate oxidase iron-sulfur subunit
MVSSNVKLFADLEVDAIITDCTSSGMMMKEKYVKLLDDDDQLHDKAVKLAGQTWEVTDYLNQLGLSKVPEKLETAYTYHVPCHRGWSPTVKEAPRQLIAKVEGSTLREMENPEKCCGAAGTFFMDHRDLSESIRSHKIVDIIETEVDLVVTQCPICRFYLSAGLKKQKEVVHPIGLIARAYGFTPEKD